MKRNYISPLTENIQLAGDLMQATLGIMTTSNNTFNDASEID